MRARSVSDAEYRDILPIDGPKSEFHALPLSVHTCADGACLLSLSIDEPSDATPMGVQSMVDPLYWVAHPSIVGDRSDRWERAVRTLRLSGPCSPLPAMERCWRSDDSRAASAASSAPLAA